MSNLVDLDLRVKGNTKHLHIPNLRDIILLLTKSRYQK